MRRSKLKPVAVRPSAIVSDIGEGGGPMWCAMSRAAASCGVGYCIRGGRRTHADRSTPLDAFVEADTVEAVALIVSAGEAVR